MHRTSRRPAAAFLVVAAAVAAAGAALAAAGCGDAGQVQGLEHDLADLQAKSKKLEVERDRLASRLDNAERRMAGMQEDLMQVRKDALAAAASAAAAAPAEAPKTDDGSLAGAPPAVLKLDPQVGAAAKELAEYFATPDGSKVFDIAMKAYEAKQQEERGARMAKGMIDVFAQRANLTPQQAASMEKIVGRSMSQIGDVWRSLRDADGGTPEERAARRTEAVAKTDEIRRQTEEEVKNVLDNTQFDLFQQEANRMRGMMGGGPGGDIGAPIGGRRGQRGQ